MGFCYILLYYLLWLVLFPLQGLVYTIYKKKKFTQKFTWICTLFTKEIYTYFLTGQNQQNGMCAQRRLGSAWASAQSDQSLRCQHEESLGS